MKKKISSVLTCCALLTLVSCNMFSIDNYDEPKETLQGTVRDVTTGDPILTNQGGDGIRVRIKEISWGENANYNPDIRARENGTYRNTKLFEGTYEVEVDGPFIPLFRQDPNQVTIPGAEKKVIDIKGVTTLDFEVQPFLKVRFAGEPQVSNGVITARIIIERGVSEEDFRAKVEPMYGSAYNPNFMNVTDLRLYVGTSPTTGENSQVSEWSNQIQYTSFSDFGNPITITSRAENNIPSGRTVFVRAAARINFDTPRGSGTRRYNYSEQLDLFIP